MSGVLTLLTALLGAGLVAAGATTWFRARLRTGDPVRSRRGRRRGWALLGTGGLLAMLPELPAALLGVLPDRSVALLVLLTLYRVLVAVGLVAVLGAIALAHERVTTPVGRLVGDVREAALRTLPVGPGRRARSLRRELGVGSFPAGWEAVRLLDRDLTARLLAYETDDRARADLPLMRDLADPVTARAYEAMLAADALRTAARPRRGADALDTAYGRAVAAFQVALDAAEARARDHATAQLSPAEREAISRAEQTLAFLGRHSASPAEREQAYAELAAALRTARGESSDRGTATVRSHPWLDVTERATR